MCDSSTKLKNEEKTQYVEKEELLNMSLSYLIVAIKTQSPISTPALFSGHILLFSNAVLTGLAPDLYTRTITYHGGVAEWLKAAVC